MKKNTIRTALFIALLSMGGYSVNAQNKELKVGTNPTIKQPSAVLEVESANKGVLMPRVTLTSITDVTTITMPANALTVFNTATAGTVPNDVTPGYYYWSTAESKWIRLLNQNDAVEPWQVEGTANKATNNTQNIYQMGNVGIGTATPEGRLHVYANSLATTPIFEKATTNVPATNFGLGIVSVRHLANLTDASLAGYTGHGSWVAGGVTLGQNYSFKSGTDAQIDIAGISAGLIDYNNKKGQLNFFVNSGISGFKSAPLSGLNPPEMVLSTDGYLGLGTATANNFATYLPPTNKLHVKTTGTVNPVRFENLQASVTPGTDKIVVADATGVLKTVTAADIAAPETNTTLSIAAGELVYANEQANNANVNLISADADNALIAGTDGRLFTPVAENIYTADGLLTSDRVLGLNNHQLTFNGTEQRTFWSADGSMSQFGSGGVASLSMYGGNDSNLYIQQFENSEAQINATDNSTSLYLGTNSTNASAPIIFGTSVGGGAIGTEKMRITGEGNIGIDQNIPTERLDIGTGNVRVRDIVSNIGAETDRIVVADATGILKTVTMANIAENIYNVDGTLTGDRIVTTDSNILRFSGTDGTMKIDNDGESEFLIEAINSNTARTRLIAGTGDLQIATNPSGNIDISAQPSGTNSFSLGTSPSANPASNIEFYTVGSTRMAITGTGNVSIGAPTPTERLDVGTGNVRVRDINANIGATSDRIVVADSNGVLKTVTAPTTTSIRTESANYAAAAADETILVNAAGGTVTVTLPSAPTVGKKYNVKKVDSTANTVTVNGNGHNIDGTATISGTLPYQGWVMQYDGSNWFIISRI
ncbi:hypothetical protein D3C87_340060 [compost metagenome]